MTPLSLSTLSFSQESKITDCQELKIYKDQVRTCYSFIISKPLDKWQSSVTSSATEYQSTLSQKECGYPSHLYHKLKNLVQKIPILHCVSGIAAISYYFRNPGLQQNIYLRIQTVFQMLSGCFQLDYKEENFHSSSHSYYSLFCNFYFKASNFFKVGTECTSNQKQHVQYPVQKDSTLQWTIKVLFNSNDEPHKAIQ